jgi:hypothetical protein
MNGGGYVYNSSPVRERLKAHEHTPEFLNAFSVYVGGSLHPDHGGDWQRMERANKWLVEREPQAPKADVRRLEQHIKEMPFEQRKLVEGFAAAAGVAHTWNFPSLTTGEMLFYRQLADWIAMSEADDIVECITIAFPGAEEISPAGDPPQPEGEPETSAPPRRKVVRVVEEDLLIPPGYLDDTDLSGTVAEIKARINAHLHAHLIAEIDGKNRKSVTDWLMGKLKGFKVPDEMRPNE